MGAFVSLLILACVVGGIAVWVRRSRPDGAPESEHAPSQARRVSLLTEAVGYIGTILLLAGAVAAVGQHWPDIGTGLRLAILSTAVVLFLGVGVVVRTSQEPALDRLAGVTWAVSVAAFAGSAGVVNQIRDTSGRTAFLTIAVPTAMYAFVLWLLHRHAIQQAVAFIGALLGTASVVAYVVHDPRSWMIAVPLWAIGIAWASSGWLRRIDPWFIAVPLGLLVTLIAPATIDISGVRYGLGIGTAAAVMAVSVFLKFVPGLAMGAVAALGYVIGAVTFYFGKRLGVPASLAIAGLLILVLVAVGTRWHWFGGRPPQPPPPEPAPGPAPPTGRPRELTRR